MKQQQQSHLAVTKGRLGLLLAVSAMATACGGPADTKMITDGSQQDYRASIDAIDARLSPHERDAFNWAVAGMDLENLNAKYPNASVKELVRGQVKAIKSENPHRIQSLLDQAKAQAPILADLQNIRTNDAKFVVESGFFGPTPIIEARIVNASSLPLSQVSWLATLYVNEQAQPSAQTQVHSGFRKIEGLKPAREVTARFKVGFVKGDEAWTTLAIRQATTTRVELSVIPESALDFSDKPYVGGNHQQAIKLLEQQLERAARFADI